MEKKIRIIALIMIVSVITGGCFALQLKNNDINNLKKGEEDYQEGKKVKEDSPEEKEDEKELFLESLDGNDVYNYIGEWQKLLDMGEYIDDSNKLFWLENSYINDSNFHIEWNETDSQFALACDGDTSKEIFTIQIGDDKKGVEDVFKRVCDEAIAYSRGVNGGDSAELRLIDPKRNEEYIVIVDFSEDKVSDWRFSNVIEGGYETVYSSYLNAQAEYGKLSEESWGKTLSEYVINKYVAYSADEFWDRFAVIYVDVDNVPEIYMLGHTFAQGDMVATLNGTTVNEQYFGNYGGSYIECNNLICNTGGHMDTYYDQVYRIKDGNFDMIASGEYGAKDNSNVQIDENGEPIYDYYWNNNKISQEEYRLQLNAVFDSKKAKNTDDMEFLNVEEVIKTIIMLSNSDR